MNQNDFKKLLEETLEPIKQGLQRVKDTQSEHTKVLDQHTKVLEQHTETLNQNTEILEKRVLPSVIETEVTVKGYADAYKTNKANIERLDDRVAKLENRADIIPAPEFTIQR